MNKILNTFAKLLVVLFLVGAQTAQAANVTGTITSPNTSVALQNGTLSFTLTQAGIIAGSFSVTSSPVSCYTSTNGAVVGLPNPLVAPSLAAGGGGSLAGTYYVKITYYASGVETLASPQSSIVISGANTSFTVTAPALQPSNATGYKVYVGTVSGSETLQATHAGWTSTSITSYSVGAALPASNNSVCSIAFNDTIIPSSTRYRVNLVDSNGNQVPGFPQMWSLTGSAVDITNQYPVSGTDTRFPSPILANPSSNAQQSVNSPLTLNGYALTAGSFVLPDNASPTACSDGRSVLYTASSDGKLMACQNGNAAVAILDAATAGWTYSSPTIRTTTATDRVMVGWSSVGDFSAAGFNGTLISNQFIYAASAVTNASVMTMGYDSGGAVGVIGMGITGSGTYRDMTVKMNNLERTRWTVAGGIVHGMASTDAHASEPKALVTGPEGIYVASTTVNASVGGMVQDSGSGTFRIVSGRSGTGVYRPMAFVLFNDAAVTNDEAARIERVNDLAGTGRVFNLEIGANAASTNSQPLYVTRGQNGSTDLVVSNTTSGTDARATIRIIAESGATDADGYFGVRSGGYSLGGLSANQVFLYSGSGATNGLQMYLEAGNFTVNRAGTVEATISSSGLALADALAQTSGGTGQATAISNTRVVFSDGTAYQGDSGFTFDTTNDSLIVKQGLFPSGTRANPTANTDYLQLWYDSATDRAAIGSFNYGTGIYQSMLFTALDFAFDANGVAVFDVTATGPRFRLQTTGVGSASLGANFPGTTPAAPYQWFRVECSDLTDCYLPAWR